LRQRFSERNGHKQVNKVLQIESMEKEGLFSDEHRMIEQIIV
jgi:hypothetical protein